MGDESNFVYFKPKSGALVKVCVTGRGAVYRYSDQIPQSENVETNENVEANLSGNVISLYTQCLALLARFTHCFESLTDFPSDFGKEIFELAVKSSLTRDSAETCTSLNTFSTAYPDLFLPSCNLSGSLVLLNNYELSLPGLLSSTSSLDLSNCHLDDSHELLGLLPASCPNVSKLNLSFNNLSDVGLRTLLLPSTLALQFLDWTGNKLEARSISRLSNLATLNNLLLLECDLSSKPDLNTLLKIRFQRVACPRVDEIMTKGWASELLSAWRDTVNVKKVKKTPISFYGANKTLTNIKEVKVPKNKVMFRRKAESRINQNSSLEISQENGHSAPILLERGEKRRFRGEPRSTSSKRLKHDLPVSPNHYEQDLLQMYKQE